MIRCKICGQELKAVTASHLKKHWVTMVVYKMIYPDAPLKDKETCQKISNTLRKEDLSNH